MPIAKWQQKANLIGKELNWLRAAAAHDDLNRQMDYLDDAILGATADRPGAGQVSRRIGLPCQAMGLPSIMPIKTRRLVLEGGLLCAAERSDIRSRDRSLLA
ncbi:hypothetical protein XI05_09145 [Bradyrhizobium sp. CCBAU 11357]|nr:hypothetical protein [Bradyrhizobium sp. CCBAU 11357]